MSLTLTIIAVIAGAQHCCSTVPRHWRQSQPGCGWNLAMKGGALPMRSTWQGQGAVEDRVKTEADATTRKVKRGSG